MSDMSLSEKKQLLKAQQGELDAVILYRKLSESIKEGQYRGLLLKIAAEEGKHAGILRNYTGVTLAPNGVKAIVVSMLYNILRLKLTMKILSKGEIKAAEKYKLLAQKFTKINEIIKDEMAHEELLKAIVVEKNK